jgi:hypothetical protein
MSSRTATASTFDSTCRPKFRDLGFRPLYVASATLQVGRAPREIGDVRSDVDLASHRMRRWLMRPNRRGRCEPEYEIARVRERQRSRRPVHVRQVCLPCWVVAVLGQRSARPFRAAGLSTERTKLRARTRATISYEIGRLSVQPCRCLKCLRECPPDTPITTACSPSQSWNS